MNWIANGARTATSISDLLDSGYDRLFGAGSVPDTLEFLFHGLRKVRQSSSREQWEQYMLRQCRQHPIRHLLLQDPLTRRAYQKPRGYAGDAVVIDFLYTHPSIQPKVNASSKLGKAIYAHTSNAAAASAVKSRRDLIAHLIDQLAYEHPALHILSIGCGHLREAQQSNALHEGRIGRLVGLDQDPKSLEIARDQINASEFELINRDVLQMIRGNGDLGKFDLVYAAGLFDYLPSRVASRLAATMFEALNPNGTMLFCNVLPDMIDTAFMESFMDWRLYHRTPEEIDGLMSRVDQTRIAEIQTYGDEFRVFFYIQLRKS